MQKPKSYGYLGHQFLHGRHAGRRRWREGKEGRRRAMITMMSIRRNRRLSYQQSYCVTASHRRAETLPGGGEGGERDGKEET